MTLHVTNGDSAAHTLREFLTDPVIITADVLHEGPAPAVGDGEWYRVRASFLADGEPLRTEEIRRGFEETDRAMAAHDGEIVLWFEHDLFDQLLLIRALARVRRASLICVDRFPGVARFIGLGQLNADQLATLAGTEHPVAPEQFALASRAWNAFRASDPSSLAELAADRETAALPFLGDALRRFLSDYPSTFNGLSRTGSLILETLSDGARNKASLFVESQSREPRPFIGDSTFFSLIDALAAARVALVTVSPDGDVAITAEGREVLAGRADAVRLNGIDQWRGGVHLSDRSPWRWDAERETLVSL